VVCFCTVPSFGTVVTVVVLCSDDPWTLACVESLLNSAKLLYRVVVVEFEAATSGKHRRLRRVILSGGRGFRDVSSGRTAYYRRRFNDCAEATAKLIRCFII
jgi:hypothetical protein